MLNNTEFPSIGLYILKVLLVFLCKVPVVMAVAVAMLVLVLLAALAHCVKGDANDWY